jgi:hypothetical protein
MHGRKRLLGRVSAMSYDKEARREAARRGWEKRRDREQLTKLQLPDYGHTPGTPRLPVGATDIPAVLPVGTNWQAALSADYEDFVVNVDPDGHVKVRTMAAPVFSKLATRIAKLDWDVKGGNAPRRKWFAKRFEETLDFPGLVHSAVWMLSEGARYAQMKPAPARVGMFLSWDFGGSEWIKEKAGGRLHNDGTHLYEVQGFPPIGPSRVAKVLPKEDFIEFRWGSTPNPEGDTTLGVLLVNIAIAWWDGFFRSKQSAKAAGIPITLVEHEFKQMRSDLRAARIVANTNAIREAQSGAGGGVVGLDAAAKARILAPTPGMLADVWLHLEKLYAIVQQAVLHNTLTSTTAGSGPAGSSTVHLSEEDAAVLVVAMKIADAINRRAVPALVRWNDGFDVPPLGADEEECYFWPQFPTEGDEGDIETDGELDVEGVGASADKDDKDDKDENDGGIQLSYTLEQVAYGTMHEAAALEVLSMAYPAMSEEKLRALIQDAKQLAPK